MNVLIAADMEGDRGHRRLRRMPALAPSAYAKGRTQMTDEVLVAIEALRDAGAGRISVGDWHMVGTTSNASACPTESKYGRSRTSR